MEKEISYTEAEVRLIQIAVDVTRQSSAARGNEIMDVVVRNYALLTQAIRINRPAEPGA